MSILNEDELLTFTFRFIDIILNNLDNNSKFRKIKAFNIVKSFANIRKLNIRDDVYTFRINNKSFVVALYDNECEDKISICGKPDFIVDKYISGNMNKQDDFLTVVYLFVPSADDYYNYEGNRLKNAIVNMFNDSNVDLFSINKFNTDINFTLEISLIYLMLSIILYFTLEDNLDTEKETESYIFDCDPDNIYYNVFKSMYDDIFKGINGNLYANSMEYNMQQEQIKRNYNNILENELTHISKRSII